MGNPLLGGGLEPVTGMPSAAIYPFLMAGLFALYRAVPDRFVSLSWTAAAAVWFCLSLLLRDIKYRHLALGTLLATVLHLFTIDLGRLDAAFRVAAFLGLGIIAVVISLFYTRIRNLIGKERSGHAS